jgi:hypothetical protein
MTSVATRAGAACRHAGQAGEVSSSTRVRSWALTGLPKWQSNHTRRFPVRSWEGGLDQSLTDAHLA